MAKFRKVWSTFWDDSFIEELTPEEKYFFLFLLTNPDVTLCGIYQLSRRKMSFYTGYNVETIDKLLLRFETSGKIKYDPEYSEVMISNWSRYNLTAKGKPIIDCLKSELKHIRNQAFIREMAESIEIENLKKVYESFYGTSTARTTAGRLDGDGDGDGDEINTPLVGEVVEYLNLLTDSRYKASTRKTRQLVLARAREGATLEQLKQVIDFKVKEWRGTDKDQYLRPETLFGSKFESYLQAAIRSPHVLPDSIVLDGLEIKLDAGTLTERNFKRLLSHIPNPEEWIDKRKNFGLVSTYKELFKAWIGKEV